MLHTVGLSHDVFLDHGTVSSLVISDCDSLLKASTSFCASIGRFIGRPRFAFEYIVCNEEENKAYVQQPVDNFNLP